MLISYLLKNIRKTPKELIISKILKKIPIISWFLSYPEVFIKFPLKNLNIKINFFRLKFWTLLVNRVSIFNYIYKNSCDKNIQIYKSQESNIKSLMEASDLFEIITKAKIFGCSYLNDFLDIEEYSSLLNEFSDENFSLPSSKILFGSGVNCINKRISKKNLKIFDEKIRIITKHLLGKNISIKEIGMQRLERVSKDINDSNTLQHIDRFLPAVKFFYFPKDVSKEQGPFGYIPFSHLINDKYIKSVKKGFLENNESPFSIPNPSDFNEVALTVKANTFVVAFTNGIHRRIPFENKKNLKRDSCRFIFYDLFTRFDLIRFLFLKT